MAVLSTGEVVAGYRIEEVVGRGGMGVVYRAVHVALDRDVALKVIVAELADDPGFRARFQREARVAASIRHPHVVTIHDAREEDGLLFLAMDYIEGTDLAAVMAETGRLDVRRAVGLTIQVASALDAAHARGLVHRDVKPANVLLARREAKELAYLTDFGLTREADSASGLTATGMMVGTVDYSAPEQLSGGPIDARTDVYALGCVLFETLTGTVPFDKGVVTAKMLAHLQTPPPRAGERVEGLPPGIDDVLAKAMAKDPDERFPSTGELARAAASATREQPAPRPAAVPQGVDRSAPTEAVPTPPPAAPPRRRRSRRWLVALTIAVVAGAVVAGVVVAGVVVLSDGGGSEEDAVRSTVHDFFVASGNKDAATVCELTAAKTKAQLGGSCEATVGRLLNGLPAQATQAYKNAKVESVTVNGTSATAALVFKAGARTVRETAELVKEDGEWRALRSSLA